MTVQEKTILIVPAYNEAEHIENTVKGLMQFVRSGSNGAAGIFDELVVVDSQSTDSTAALARSAGATVVPLTISKRGKGQAFLQGALYCKNKGAKIIVTMDADLFGHPKREWFDEMLNQLGSNSSLDMVVYPVDEKYGDEKVASENQQYSGVRAIRTRALNFLFTKSPANDNEYIISQSDTSYRFRRMSRGYGLEVALNWQIGWRNGRSGSPRLLYLYPHVKEKIPFRPPAERENLFKEQADNLMFATGVVNSRIVYVGEVKKAIELNRAANGLLSKPQIRKIQ
jgi:glycosyltransferase involved in cell wall biosynthesis